MSGTSSFPQAHWTKPWPRPKKTMITSFPIMQQFPDEIILAICDQTTISDLLNLVVVSRRFHDLATTALWRAAKHRLYGYPLYLGAVTNNIPLMEKALLHGCDINKPWYVRRLGRKYGFKKGQRPLHMAVANTHADAVDWLLAHGASTQPVSQDDPTNTDLSLLYLAADWEVTWKCLDLDSEPDLEASLASSWDRDTGARYHIFRALMEAGARPPPGQMGAHLRRAAASCRIVSAPTLQMMLLHGADPNQLCPCPWHYDRQDGDRTYPKRLWIWETPNNVRCCEHRFNFAPWPRPIGEIMNTARICGELAMKDREGRRLFFCVEDDEAAGQ